MKTAAILTLAAALFGQGIDGHGYVLNLRINGGTVYPALHPTKDPGKNVRITREFYNNGPIPDGDWVSGSAITCNGNNKPSPLTAPVPAGAKVEFLWSPWNSDHPGPIITYLAKCPGKCSDFAASGGNIWVKIHQDGFDGSKTPYWASKRLPLQNSTWPITLPKSIENGEYILRHEIVGLQRSNTDPLQTQFYPACHQITITGGGSTKLPSGVAIPGAYKPTDPGINLNYRKLVPGDTYVVPGGPVWGDNGWQN